MKIKDFFSRVWLIPMLFVAGVIVFSLSDVGSTSAQPWQIINTTTEYDQMYPAVAMNNNGSGVVVWHSLDFVGGGMPSRVYFQIFDSYGGRVGGEQLLTSDEAINPDVAMDEAGNFYIVWTNPQTDEGWVAGFDRLGNRRWEARYSAGIDPAPKIATTARGDLFITWMDFDLQSLQVRVLFQAFHEDGDPRWDTEVVASFPLSAGVLPSPEIAVSSDGKVGVVIWYDRGADALMGRRIYEDGRLASTSFLVKEAVEYYVDGSEGASEKYDVAVSAIGENLEYRVHDILVVYVDLTYRQSGRTDIRGRWLSQSGSYYGQDEKLNSITSGRRYSPAVTMDEEGNFIAAWSAIYPFTADRDRVFYRRFAHPLSPDDEEDVRLWYSGYSAYAPAVAGDGDRYFAVVWHAASAGSGYNIVGGVYNRYGVQVLKPAGHDIASNDKLPTQFAIHQNNPNPFNPETDIRFELPEAGQVTLRIYDLLGREIATLSDTRSEAGYYNAVWNGKTSAGRDVASGVYFYRFEVQADSGERFVATRKMSLLR